MLFPKKLTSRKFWLAQQIVYLSIGVPLLFRSFGIGESITLMTLGVIGGAGTLYGVVSTLDKKLNAPGSGEGQ